MKEHYNINVTNNAAKALEGIKNNRKEDYNITQNFICQNQKILKK